MDDRAHLSAFDAMFLRMEEGGSHMHVAAVLDLDGGPLRGPGGALDIERLRRHVSGRLAGMPHFRQRLAAAPILSHPMWIDDERFAVERHVRVERVDPPGDHEALRRLVGRLLSTPLPRDHPLWEFVFVDGLAGDRCVMVAKAHHCMLDGVTGIAVLGVLLDTEPNSVEPRPDDFRPAPAPSSLELLAADVGRRTRVALDLVRRLGRVIRSPRELYSAARRLTEAATAVAGLALHPAAPTPLNPTHLGSDRAVEWRELDLAALRSLKHHGGATVNDAVLAVLAGALREYLALDERHPLRGELRVGVPVSLHTAGQTAGSNEVSVVMVPLPVHLADPEARLRAVVEAMRAAKSSSQQQVVELFTRQVAEITGDLLVPRVVRLSIGRRPYNLSVSNVHGPSLPLYLLGARLRAIHPTVPLFEGQALSVAMISYCGRVHVGLLADPAAVPDLTRFASAIERALDELLAATAPRAPIASPSAIDVRVAASL